MPSLNESKIRSLVKENFFEQHVDLRAVLRRKELWKNMQEPNLKEFNITKYHKQEGSAIKAAD